MKFYDLEFTDGKRCRMIDPEGDGLEPTNFHPGYMRSMTRVIGTPPAKLPWKRDGAVWRIGSFELIRIEGGRFRVTWPSGSAEGGKDEISAAVRENWMSGA